MPSPGQVARPKLIVVSHPWRKGIFYRDKAGKKQNVNNYAEAREHAKAQGYSGIKIVGRE